MEAYHTYLYMLFDMDGGHTFDQNHHLFKWRTKTEKGHAIFQGHSQHYCWRFKSVCHTMSLGK